MKRIIIVVSIFSSLLTLGQSPYRISGEFSQPPSEQWIYLAKFMESQPRLDSARIIDGKFTFTGYIDFPEVYALHFHPERITGIYPFFIEPGEIEITIDVESDWFLSTIKGGKINDQYLAWKRGHETIDSRIMKLTIELKNSQDRESELKLELENARNEKKETIRQYVIDHSDSPISIFILSSYTNAYSIDEISEMLQLFSKPIKQTSIYRKISESHALKIGLKNKQPALSFAESLTEFAYDLKSNSILKTLPQLYPGKILMVDVWGTWCGPCLEQIPHLERLKVNLKTDAIMYVSLCIKSSEENWRKLILSKKIRGEHFLLNDQLEKKLALELPDFLGVPRYIIIDSRGKIINDHAPLPSNNQLEIELRKLLN